MVTAKGVLQSVWEAVESDILRTENQIDDNVLLPGSPKEGGITIVNIYKIMLADSI